MWDFSQPGSIVFWSTCLFGCALWLNWLRKSWQDPQARWGPDKSVAARWGLLEVLGIAFVLIAAQSMGLSLGLVLTGRPPDPVVADAETRAVGLIGAGLVQLVAVGLVLYFLCARYCYGRKDFGLTAGQNWTGIRLGIVGFAMWVPVVWIVQDWLVQFIDYSHTSLDRLIESPEPIVSVQIWFSAVVVAPITEEFLFRTVLQGWLQRLGRPESDSAPGSLLLGQWHVPGPVVVKPAAKDHPIHWLAIVITSVLFALAHFDQGPAPVSLFVFSLGLGYLYQRTGSLLACVVMHLLLNLVTLVLVSTGSVAI